MCAWAIHWFVGDCNKAMKYPMFIFAHIADADGLSYFVAALLPLHEWHIVGRTRTRMRTFRFSKWRQCAGALSERVSWLGECFACPDVRQRWINVVLV